MASIHSRWADGETRLDFGLRRRRPEQAFRRRVALRSSCTAGSGSNCAPSRLLSSIKAGSVGSPAAGKAAGVCLITGRRLPCLERS